jgi:CheY-like chemotaxis protein
MNKNKVLLIEDDPDILEEIQTILRFEDFKVVSTDKSTEGVKIARETLPDIILCDIMMPEMDGYEVLEELRKDPVTEIIPFIFLTAMGEKKDLRRGMELGADDYLTKPLQTEELLKAIGTQIDKSRKHVNRMEYLRQNIISYLPHEFNTPLTGILGFSEILKNMYGKLEPERVLEMVEHIYQSGKRLQKLIYKYMRYTQVQLDSFQKEKSRPDKITDLSLILEKTAHYEAQKAERKEDLELEIKDFDLNFPEDELEVVLKELLENAFRFSEKGEPVKVKTIPEKNQIEIMDYGRGFKEEFVDKIGAYMQFDRKKYEQQGAGLGLITAKKIMEKYGKSLKIAPLEKGTRIILDFQ